MISGISFKVTQKGEVCGVLAPLYRPFWSSHISMLIAPLKTLGFFKDLCLCGYGLLFSL